MEITMDEIRGKDAESLYSEWVGDQSIAVFSAFADADVAAGKAPDRFAAVLDFVHHQRREFLVDMDTNVAEALARKLLEYIDETLEQFPPGTVLR